MTPTPKPAEGVAPREVLGLATARAPGSATPAPPARRNSRTSHPSRARSNKWRCASAGCAHHGFRRRRKWSGRVGRRYRRLPLALGRHLVGRSNGDDRGLRRRVPVSPRTRSSFTRSSGFVAYLPHHPRLRHPRHLHRHLLLHLPAAPRRIRTSASPRRRLNSTARTFPTGTSGSCGTCPTQTLTTSMATRTGSAARVRRRDRSGPLERYGVKTKGPGGEPNA
jgi:hypothetical protein